MCNNSQITEEEIEEFYVTLLGTLQGSSSRDLVVVWEVLMQRLERTEEHGKEPLVYFALK